MSNFLRPLAFWLLLATSICSRGWADPTLEVINERRATVNRTALIVNGAWAVSNIAGALILGPNKTGEEKWFWNGNLYWNLIALGIVGTGWWVENSREEKMGLPESLETASSDTRFFSFLTGLDIGFIATGITMNAMAGNEPDPVSRNKLLGYGKTFIVQGLFLLCLDGTTLFFQRGNETDLMKLLKAVRVSDTGLMLHMTF